MSLAEKSQIDIKKYSTLYIFIMKQESTGANRNK